MNLGISQDLNYSTIDNSLIQDIEQSPTSFFDIYLILEDKVDVKSLDDVLTARKADEKLRSKTIITALQNKAKKSQADILQEMHTISGVKKESITSYWLANVIFLRANVQAIAHFSNDNRIEFIGVNGELLLVESESEGMAEVSPNDREIGLDRINVEPMWDLGYTGYGQLALVADTGIDPTHNSFAHKYRGNTNANDQSWYRYNNQSATPFQCGDHGTHVLGTVLGLDRTTNDTIGVAFDAQWMGSANLCGGGTESNIGTFQWATNPDGDLDTTDDMADVINNSWWDPSIADNDCNSVYVDVLVAVEAIGVVVVFSAGNAGPEPLTITAPHNINVELVNSFTVAALNGNSANLPIANFSSRGPSICGGDGALAIKPEVAAPGQGVRSAVLGNEYGFKSGTSMAAPHVSGAILILKQAFPDATAKDLKLALYYTCRDLGELGEDNTYGRGIIDVYEAYLYLIEQGYNPVPAISDNDLIAYTIVTDRFECNETLSSEFVFFNNSSDTLTSMIINTVIDNNIEEKITNNWTGSLAPYKMDTIVLEDLNIAAGEHNIEIELSSPNGKQDSRLLNNKINKEFLVSSRMKIQIASIEDQYTCEGASTLLQTEYDGDGLIQWFDREVGGNKIGEGTQFAASSDNYDIVYADILRDQSVGKNPVSIGNISLANDRGQGLVLNSFYPSRITEFDFYSEQTGNIFIGLEDGRGNQVDSELIPTDGSGWQTAKVSIRVPEGFNYRLLYKDGAAQFATTSSNVNYPYVVDDIISIVRATDGNDKYNYFFNLKVEFLDLCGRVPVVLNAVETDSLPYAEFTTSTNIIDTENNVDITFMSNSTNASEFQWDFGDGSTSTDENPTHRYESIGVYFPSLLVRSSDGCSDAFVQRVDVFSSAPPSTTSNILDSSSFTIAPNPVIDHVVLATESPIFVDRVDVYNSAGIGVITYNISELITSKFFDIQRLQAGLYFFAIHTKEGINTQKVMKF